MSETNSMGQNSEETSDSILLELLSIMRGIVIDMRWHGISSDKRLKQVENLVEKIKNR